tara:strand:- start:196 stop:675 length:480 start_codon:yes stop_codon:yes gene_type:complete
MKKIAVYPGTFDPITNGHFDLVKRGLKLFDRIIIAVALNPQKKTLFSINERVSLINSMITNQPSLEVHVLDKLVVNFAKTHSATIILRGLRAISDFEYEVQLASMNRSMEPNIESVFMSPAEEFSFLSSSIVKDIARHGGNLEKYVHQDVAKALKEKLQ